MANSNPQTSQENRLDTVPAPTPGGVTPEQTIPVGPKPFGIAASDPNTAFVSTRLGIVSLKRIGATWRSQSLIPLPVPALGLALNGDRTILAAACLSSVVFVDPVSGTVIGKLRIPGPRGTVGAIFTTDGRYIFISNERQESVTVIEVNEGVRPRIHGSIPVDHAPVGLAVDEQNLYVTCEAIHREGKVGSLKVVDIRTAVTDPGSGAVVSTVPAEEIPVRVVLSHQDGQRYTWVSARASNALLTFDTEMLIRDPDNALVTATPIGPAPVGLEIFDGGRRLAVANSNRFQTGQPSTMAVFDIGDWPRGQQDPVIVQVGVFPRQFGKTPDGKTLFLTNFGSEEVMVFGAGQFAVFPDR